MPYIQYKGFAAKLADTSFSRKMFAINLSWLFLLSIYVIWSNHGLEPTPHIPRAVLCKENEIEWEDFMKHSCESEDLWVVINGHVYDMWPWGMLDQGNAFWII